MTYAFYIDEGEEISTLNEMLLGAGGCSSEDRAKEYGIPVAIAQKCQKGKIPSELTDFVRQGYLKNKPALDEALQFHYDYWTGKGQQHLQKISTVMGQKIPDFRVRLDLFCSGTSDWVGTNISIQAFEYKNNPSAWYFSVLWETILAITFQKIRQKYTPEQFSDSLVWAVSEMTSCAIINTEFPVIWNIGYAQLFPHQQKVIQLYQQRRSFHQFIESVLQYFIPFSDKIFI